MITQQEMDILFSKWIDILRIKNNWDIQLELVNDPLFKKQEISKLIAMTEKLFCY